MNNFQDVFFVLFSMQVPIKLTSVCSTDFSPQWDISPPHSRSPHYSLLHSRPPHSSPPHFRPPHSNPPHFRPPHSRPQSLVTVQLPSGMAKRVNSQWTTRTCLPSDGWAMTHTTNTLQATPQDGTTQHLMLHSPPHPSPMPQLPSNRR